MAFSCSTTSSALLALLMLLSPFAAANSSDSGMNQMYDPDAAMQHSQAAIGNRIGDYVFTDTSGKEVKLTEYAGAPLLLSLIYTACYHTCPVTTQYLDNSVKAAREVFEQDSFNIVTIGFDSPRDTPQNMRTFAREQGIDVAGWDFLSGSSETIQQLADDLGFIYFPSPRGFDHITQLTVVDSESHIYAQVYGGAFSLPWMVEPLKELIFNRPSPGGHMFTGLLGRVRLFCTVYDPSTGRYEFDYSLFIQIAIGLLVVLSVSIYLVWEYIRARHQPPG